MAKIIDIDFNENEEDLIQMQEVFNELGSDAFFYSHHDLAAASEYSPMDWRMFLTDPRVQEYMQGELFLMQKSAVMKMMKDIDRSKSPGQAQLLNTLVQQTNSNKTKDGPVFIYTYIPLNEEEKYAPNVRASSSDPFKTSIR